MRRFTWIVTLPIAALVVLFAVDNRQTVALELWPLPWALPPVPLFLLTLLMVLFGFVFGVAVMWVSGAKQRRQLRNLRRDLDVARSDLHAARHQATAQSATGTALAPTRGRLPAA